MQKIKLFSILAFALLMSACGKDDDDGIQVGEVTNIEYSYSYGSLSVTWDAYDGAYSYKLFINGEDTHRSYVGGTSAVLTDIEEQDVITIEAYSDDAETVKIAEGEITFIKDKVEAPAAPTNLTATEVTDSSATIQFNYTGTCAGINIYSEAKTDNSTPIATIEVVSEGENNVDFDSLTSETEYSFYFYAFNTDGEETAYSTDEAKITLTTSKKEVFMEITDYGYDGQYDGSLTLSVKVVASDLFSDESEWTDTGDLILELYSATSEDGEFVLANTDDYIYPSWTYNKIVRLYAYKNDMNYVDGQTYYLKAVAKNKDGETLAETVVQEVKFEEPVSEEIIPGAPTNVKLELDGNCVKITWNSAENATKYKVYVATSSNMSYKSLVETTTSTSATDCDRGKNVKMYYKVTAISSTGNAKSSSVVSIWL
ncbi:fibronectin type III domain-containing protein [Geofilum sp. OHC36d9]|uniref:fibronectin type III domain-containing protein n=1 Tax=Geofilum sp. OHC36d9 TaxID=3458413 RepID=UPI0040338C15